MTKGDLSVNTIDEMLDDCVVAGEHRLNDRLTYLPTYLGLAGIPARIARHEN